MASFEGQDNTRLRENDETAKDWGVNILGVKGH